jgi:soluble lytic murein transglycosylase
MLLARPRILAALVVILTPLALLTFSWLGELQRSQELEPLIVEAAARHNLPATFVRAVVWRESDFDSKAVGTSGERGLMQVTPGAAHDWAQATRNRTFQGADLFDPRTNLAAGTWYLSRAMKRWTNADHPEVFALAEYNAGITNARRWAKQNENLRASDFLQAIDFPTTRAYIRAIMKRTELYATGKNPGPLELVNRRLALQKERWIKKSP